MSHTKRSRLSLAVAAFAAMLGAMATPLAAQETGTIQGKIVEQTSARPLSGAQVTIPGTQLGAVTSASGDYRITGVPAGSHTLHAEMIGYEAVSKTVTATPGQVAEANFTLAPAAISLNGIVVTALGQTTKKREIGVAQQTVSGEVIAQSQRTDFINALQGRVAGVEVTSTSGVPGASSSITIRGVSSISSSNQPLVVVDGLPVSNNTLNTGAFAADQSSRTDFANRGVDFTNRAADINPKDIASITVLKGPTAAALYGIDAANGAIVITTKHGQAGGGLTYSNSFEIATPRIDADLQRIYAPSDYLGRETFDYWGDPYPAGTQFYDNIGSFFQTALTQKHNLSFDGATQDGRLSYRISGALTDANGIVPTSKYNRINLTGASNAQVTDWLRADLTMQYIKADNDQPFKGTGGPLISLMTWPGTDDASVWLTPAGTRRLIKGTDPGAEMDNPFFNVHKNAITSRSNRVIANLGLTLMPFEWGNLKTNIGVDAYTNQNQILRHPESNYGLSENGILDVADNITRNVNVQTILSFNPVNITHGLTLSGFLGQAIKDENSHVDALEGMDFMEPNFVSVNNTLQKTALTTITQRRLLSGFGSATLGYNDYLFVTATGRNDWTSTIPKEANSFFYPSVNSSFVFSDAFPAVGKYVTGKLRAAYAEVGRDASPYAYTPALQNKTTSYGGYGYNFWGPNRNLRPEFATSYEFGTELGFFNNRLGLDATYYHKQTTDQIVQNIRGSYATGFILFNLNGASTENHGVELSLRGTPVLTPSFSWDFLVNFDRARGTVLSLPHDLPESYVSDTWLYGNVRNGVMPGLSTRSLTGTFFLRNDAGQLLINPTNGLPVTASNFIDAGYDRQPNFTMGVTNTFNYGPASLSFLVDIRRGGDILNATDHYLTTRGLTEQTLDRNEPRVIAGVLRDGKENTANPTPNNIVVIPAVETAYYRSMSEELFIEKDINWLRLRNVTLRVGLPGYFGKNASAFVTGTDLLLFTNYTGLDPVVNGNTAAVGGSGGAGLDWGNFPLPRGINFGISTSF